MWVFGYGSLLWNPGFAYQHHKLVRLNGYRRSFSMSSNHHRGTKYAPGLVLALDKSESSECYETRKGHMLTYMYDACTSLPKN